MPLLILCLFGQASADTGDQVDGMDLFLLMVTFVITLGIVFVVYLKGRNTIPSQVRDTDSPHTICRLIDPLDTLPLSYRVRAVYPRCRKTNPIHRSTDTTFARNMGREVEVRFPCGSCDSDSRSCDVSTDVTGRSSIIVCSMVDCLETLVCTT